MDIDFNDFFMNSNTAVSPFVKWVGGKKSIIKQLTSRVPKTYIGYEECFVGGGILFFTLQPSNACLSDINKYLILTYQAIRDNVKGVIAELEKHYTLHEKQYFLKARKVFNNNEFDSVKVAGLFIYLNKACYNGLYRVNKNGEFNSSFGSYGKIILNKINLWNVSQALQGVTIKNRSFEEVEPEKGVFYYLDPPYYHTYNMYDFSRFNDEQHEKLAQKCHDINDAGGYFMLSNSNSDFIRDIYKGFNIENLFSRQRISCTVDQRKLKSELLIRNYE